MKILITTFLAKYWLELIVEYVCLIFPFLVNYITSWYFFSYIKACYASDNLLKKKLVIFRILNTSSMANATFVILLIFSGNTFTIFVFWKNRKKLKRTSFLLINLAVADLLVGLSQMIMTGVFYIPDSLQTNITSVEDNLKHSLLSSYQLSLPFASVFFLVLISLERAYALIWLLRHRVASIRGYIYSAIFVWGAAIALQVGNLLMLFFHFSEIDHWMIAVWSIAALSLIVICACYVAIRAKLSSSKLVSVASENNSLEQNKKLSRTDLS